MPVNYEADNVVATGLIGHGIYPSRHEEIDQNVILQDQYQVLGGIFARSLKVLGSGEVHGPVATVSDIFLDQTENQGQQVFLSGLTTPDIIRNQAPPLPISETCVSDLGKATLLIRGPITTGTVQLQNAVVIGNIHARNVELNSCVVFGIIDCSESLLLENCNFVAYRAGRARLRGRMSTWLGYGISEDGIEFLREASRTVHLEPGQDLTGDSIPPDLRYIPICLSGNVCDRQENFEFCDLYHSGRCPSCLSGETGDALFARISLSDLDFQLRILQVAGGRGVLDETPDSVQTDELSVRFDRNGERQQSRMNIQCLQEVFGDDEVDPSSIQILEEGEGWHDFFEDPRFTTDWKLVRVLSVAGRLLNAGQIKSTLLELTNMAKAMAYWPCITPGDRAKIPVPERAGTRELWELGTRTPNIREKGAGK